MVAIHTDSRNSVDDKRFAEVNDLRFYLAKDSDDRQIFIHSFNPRCT